MPTSCSYFHSTLHGFLSFHISKVEVTSACLLFIENLTRVIFQRTCLTLSGEEFNHISQSIHTIDFKIIHDCSLISIRTRKYHSLITFFPCLDGNRKGTTNRLESAVKTKLTYEKIFVERFLGHILIGGKYANSNRQIKRRTFLTQISRGKVYGYRLIREFISTIQICSSDSALTLAHSLVAQSREIQALSCFHAHLYRDCGNFQTVYCCTICFYKHKINYFDAKI